jgi:hypothetical protein
VILTFVLTDQFDIFRMHLDGKAFKNLHIIQILRNFDTFDTFGQNIDKGHALGDLFVLLRTKIDYACARFTKHEITN